MERVITPLLGTVTVEPQSSPKERETPTWTHQSPENVSLNSIIMNVIVTPGPGTYRMQSDFGYYNVNTSTLSHRPTTSKN